MIKSYNNSLTVRAIRNIGILGGNFHFMKPKIAFLILIHKKNFLTMNLISYLSQDFDLYIHVDKKSNFSLGEKEFLFKERVHIYRKYRVYHGRFSMLLAELFLMREAFKMRYDRYIIISGADIPLKTNHEITNFFTGNRKEYLTYEKLPLRDRWGKEGGLDRIKYYHTFYCRKNDGNGFQYIISKTLLMINKILIMRIFKFFNISRPMNHVFYGGSSWMNLTHKCVSGILSYLSQNEHYIERFRYTSNGDEIFFQTIICNYISGLNLVNHDLRLLDWSHPQERPYIFKKNDLKRLLNCGDHLFARKFDPNVDSEIIVKMFNKLPGKFYQIKSRIF